jgi:ribose/xylose/arabinose/galactoside ABC-type transport system permease subunit
MFVILTAGIDVSVGGVSLVSIMLAATLTTETERLMLLGYPVAWNLGLFLMVLLGISFGMLNGSLVSRINMPPLIVTLGMWLITKGIAYQFSGGFVIGAPREIGFFGQGVIGGVPVPVVMFIVVAVIAYFILNHTTFGKSVYAVGGNPVNAWLSGVNVSRILFSVYAISGFLAAMAGMIFLARTLSGSMTLAAGLELDTIAAVAVGGVSLAGGKGNVLGVILGVLIITVVKNGMIMFALEQSYQDMVTGGIIIAAVAVDVMRRR